jgi:hypothetical protein
MSEWMHEGVPPYADGAAFAVWLDDNTVRAVRRAGSRGPMTPGTLLFTDSRNPMANALCDESRVRAWRQLPPERPNDANEQRIVWTTPEVEALRAQANTDFGNRYGSMARQSDSYAGLFGGR